MSRTPQKGEERVLLTLEELKEAASTKKSTIEKTATVSYDGKNQLIRIPKEVVDFLQIKKGDKFQFIIDVNNKKMQTKFIHGEEK